MDDVLTGDEILNILADLVIDSSYCQDKEQEILNFIEDIREGLPIIFGEI
ncbi:MAG: hypothetical protein L6276_04315 [Acetobacterium sp.]|nr:hypothetical protein [Bacillota bacterium]MCG2729491.1 hypothetical protein [Acetobacterium sp.]